MANSVSEWVAHYLDEHPFIKTGLRDDIINYSALARKLLPAIEKDMGKTVNVDSVMVAIRRYGERQSTRLHDPHLREMLEKASITLQDGMSFAMLENAEKVENILFSTLEGEPWGSTEFRIIMGSSSHIIALLKQSKMTRLLERIPPPDQLRIEHGFSIVTIKIPLAAFKSPSLMSEVSMELSKTGIPHMVLGVPPEVHFVVSEHNSARAYASFKALIENGQELKTQQLL
ncbi:MAG: hypothetical protein Q8P05_04150 [Candidatus Diapherotrites archaeon]|nr:hypothetical protein [Candidatus Diapherotrites archaeon]MDZ4256576.1 hypothetical protein [archaeon]